MPNWVRKAWINPKTGVIANRAEVPRASNKLSFLLAIPSNWRTARQIAKSRRKEVSGSSKASMIEISLPKISYW
jgi:hypothetical protein